jgi:hypothetical protein
MVIRRIKGSPEVLFWVRGRSERGCETKKAWVSRRHES